MMSEELKPCPFCGNENAMSISADRDSKERVFPIVRCMGCFVDVPGKNFDFSENCRSAIKAWNTRTND